MAVETARMQGSRKGRPAQNCRLEITFPPHCYSCATAILRSCRQLAGSAQTRAGRQGAGPGGGCRAEYRGERRACDQIFLLLLAVFVSQIACFMCAAPGALRRRGDTSACCSKEAVAPAAGGGQCCHAWRKGESSPGGSAGGTLSPGYHGGGCTPQIQTAHEQPSTPSHTGREPKAAREAHSSQRMLRASTWGLEERRRTTLLLVGHEASLYFK